MAPMRLRERFGREVRDARVALDVSQREVATAVGVSRGYITHLENGRANPSLRVIERVVVRGPQTLLGYCIAQNYT